MVLAEHFLTRCSAENHKHVDGFSDGARSKMLAHRWTGNVRALENAVERAVVMCDGPLIEADDLPFEAAVAASNGVLIPGASMEEIERHAILRTLESVDGSTARAAEILGLSVRMIQYRVHEYGLSDTPKAGRRRAAST